MSKNRAKHDDPEFRAIGKAMRTAANNNPNATCSDCKLTLAQKQVTHPHAVWHCGHPKPYRLLCSPCNTSDGAHHINTQRASTYNW